MFGLFVLASLCALSAAHPSRVVGGGPVEISEVPYQLSLRLNGDHVCGAVLVSGRYALTTAVCVSVDGDYSVRAGSANRNSGGVVENVAKIDVHPDWTGKSRDHDIAVLTLENALQLDDTVKPIKLAASDMDVPSGETATLSGWGATEIAGTELADTVNAAQIPVLSKFLCKSYYVEDYTENMMCTGRSIVGGIGACKGDAGSALILDGELIGLASFAESCGVVNIPDVSSFVPKYVEFIKSITQL